MRTEGHIGLLQATILVFTVLTAKAILPFPGLAVRLGQTAGWLLMLMIGAVAAVLSLIIATLLERHPGRGLAAIAEEVAGPVGGILLNTLFLGWLLIELALVMRLFTEMFISAVLPNTPPSVVALLMIVIVIYAANGGLEPVSRANLILAPLIVVAFVATLLTSIKDLRLDWLFPLWGPGPAPLAWTAIRTASFSGEVFLLAIHAYALREARLFRRAGLMGLGLSSVALAATVAVFVMAFGVEGAVGQPFPLFSLARLTYLGRFFQRSEALFVLFWALTAMIYLAVILHAAAVTAGAVLAVPYYRPLLYPVGLLAFALSLVPRNFLEAMVWIQTWRSADALVTFGVPALLLVLSLVRGRTGRERAAGEVPIHET